MFAVIKTGGKQYKVAPNDIIQVEKLAGTSGELIEFTDVLMTGQGNSVKIGAPWVANAKVYGTVLDQVRDDKVIIFKKNRRHNYRRKNGHRQYLTVVQITDILPEGGAPKAKAQPVKAEAKTEKPAKKVAPKAEVKAVKPAPKPTPKVEAKAEKPVTKAASKAKAPAKKPAAPKKPSKK